MKLGDVLRIIREEKGLSAMAMAEKLKLSVWEYRELESGESQMERYAALLVRFAEVTGKPLRQCTVQLIGGDRFGDIVIHPGDHTLFPVSLHGVGGHCNHRDAVILHGGVGVANSPRCFVAVHQGHLAIHQYQVVGKLLQRP